VPAKTSQMVGNSGKPVGKSGKVLNYNTEKVRKVSSDCVSKWLDHCSFPDWVLSSARRHRNCFGIAVETLAS